MNIIRRSVMGLLTFGMVFLGVAICHAGPIPDTGQTKIYHRDIRGTDSQYMINAPSYTKLDALGKALPAGAPKWAMVKDNITGLIWEVKNGQEGIHFWRSAYTFEEAQDKFISKLNTSRFGGFADWRIPTVMELTRILHKDGVMPSINADYFPATYTLDYWTTTPYAKDAAKGWRVHFCRGFVSEMPKTKKYFVRAVRGPIATAQPLVDNGDGTITNPATGLMWQQAYTPKTTWQDALVACEKLELGGFSDWRLPNAHELQSVVDYNRSWPAADRTLWKLPRPKSMERPITEGATEFEKKHGVDKRFCFWSSSEYASNADKAWNVDFKIGRFYSSTKEMGLLYRAVRGGQVRQPAKLFVQSPQQGSTWKVGQTMTIAWDHHSKGGHITISLSRAGGRKGTFDQIIADKAPNSGQFSWQVAGKPSVNCVLRIEHVGQPDKTAQQGLFTISAPTAPETKK